MEIVQEIGSYAGLAAIFGLAVLSALYFSQARDVKRLREWAGRAPERAPEPAQRTAAAPVGQSTGVRPVPRAPGQTTPAGSKDNGDGTVTAPGGQRMTPGLDFGQLLQKFGIGGTNRLPATGSTGSTGNTSGVGS